MEPTRTPMSDIHLPEPPLAKAKDFRRAGKACGVRLANRFVVEAEALAVNGKITDEASDALGKVIAAEMAEIATAFRLYGYREDHVGIFENCMKVGFKSVRVADRPETPPWT